MATGYKSNIDTLLKKTFHVLQPDLRELLQEKLDEYDLSRSKVITLLNIDKVSFEDIISGQAKQPNLFNVIKIAEFLEINIDEVIASFLKNQTVENIASIERAKKALFVSKNFDIKKLSKIGFFNESDDAQYLYTRILSFFGYTSIEDYEDALVKPLYSKTKRTFSDKMKKFWVHSAIQCFTSVANPNEYDREALKDIIVKIKPYCQDVENGLLTVCKALYNVGVTVIVQNHLTLTQVRGGTFVVGGKPCIVLTDLNKRYTTIWETLIHELHHVLYDLEAIEKEGYHLTGEGDVLLIEEKAEEFAQEYFFGFSDYKYIKPHIHTPYIVSRYANDLEIHPSFVYSSFRLFEKKLYDKNYYQAFHEFFPDCYLAIKNLKPITWKESSLSDVAEDIKSIFEINV